MTALTAAYDAKRKDGELISYPLAAGAKIYKGALVCVTLASGFVSTGADAAGVAFVGVACESADNTGGANGAKSIRVQKTGSFVFNAQGAAQTDVSKPAFIIDDNTVKTAATTNSIAAGIVVGCIDGTHLTVRVGPKVN